MQEMPVFTSSRATASLDPADGGKAKADRTRRQPPHCLGATRYVPRAASVNDGCPADARTASPYGGVRLQLQPGDHLRIRLVNQLPPAPPTPNMRTIPIRWMRRCCNPIRPICIRMD